MTDRERLIELLNQKQEHGVTGYANFPTISNSELVDHLLANGVIVPPCKVGQIVYLIKDDCVCDGKVKSLLAYAKTMIINGMYWNEDKKGWYDFTSPLCCFGKDVFLTKEEAEQALKECEQVD